MGAPGRIGEEGVRRERKGWEVGVLKNKNRAGEIGGNYA